MKSLFTICLTALALLAGQLQAQVNGTASRPITSTVEKPVYYYIESAANGTVAMGANAAKNYLGNLLYAPTSTAGVQLKHELMATITGAGVSIDNAIWQIVNEGGVVKLKNKGTGLFLVDARFGNTANANQFIATALNTPATQYSLRNSNQTNPSVAWNNVANGNYIDRWGSTAANSQVAWFFLVVPGSEANYSEYYTLAIKSELLGSISKAENLVSGFVSEGIVYTQENKTILADAKTTAQAVYDNAASTDQQLLDAKTALDAAITTFKATAVVTPEKLLSENTASDRWYRIKNTATHAYAKDKVMSVGARVTGEKFTFEAAVEEDKQLFRVELTDDKTKIKNIINKKDGKFVAPNGAVSDTAFVVTNSFALNILTDGISMNIKPSSVAALHAQEANTHIVNWAGDSGSASAWVFEYVMETPKVITSTSQIDSKYKVLVNNRIITVDGVKSYEIYSVTGQRQALNVSLQQGVYIVKSSEFTAKVMVK